MTENLCLQLNVYILYIIEAKMRALIKKIILTGFPLLFLITGFTNSCSIHEESFMENPLILYLLYDNVFNDEKNQSYEADGLRDSLNVDLKSIKGLVISNDSSSGVSARDGEDSGSLYAVNKDGTMDVVTVYESDDGEEEEIRSTYTPLYISKLPSFVMFAYEYAPCNLVAARISDNKLFCATSDDEYLNFEADYDQDGNRDYSTTFQSDDTGNFYMRIAVDGNNDGSIVSSVDKIDLSDPSNPTRSTVLDGTILGDIVKYRVDGDGNMILYNYETLGMRFSSGAFDDLMDLSPDDTEAPFLEWGLSPGGTFYLVDQNIDNPSPGNPLETVMVVLDVSGNPVTGTEYSITSSDTYTFDDSYSIQNYIGNKYTCSTSDKVYAAYDGPLLIQLDVDAATPDGDFIDLGDDVIDRPRHLICGDSKVYIKGARSGLEDAILLFNETTSKVTTLLDGGYRITDMSVASDGKISFSGASLGTGNYIIAEIDPSTSGLTIISDDAPEITQLVPLN